MLKNVSGQKIGAQLVSATDGSAFTGSVTVAVTVDAGTQATGSVGSGACTHEGGGYHTYAPAQAETNGDLIAFTFSGTGAVPVTVQVYTLPTTGVLAPATLGRTVVVDAAGLVDANAVKVGPSGSGTAQTAGDLKSLIDAVDNFVDTEIAALQSDITTLLSRLGTPSNLGGGASVAANLADIEAQTDDIGTAGAGLSAIPWNSAWDTEVQSEVQDALEVNHLDHLIAVADPGGVVANSSFLAKMVSKSATPAFASYDNTTDSQEALRDRGDSAWTTVTAGSIRSAVGLASANLDTQIGTLATAANLATVAGYLDTEVAAILAAVDTEIASILTAVSSTIPATLAGLFTSPLTESYRADGATGSVAELLYELLAHHSEVDISGTTKRLNKLDGTTQAVLLTLNHAVSPTAVTRAA